MPLAIAFLHNNKKIKLITMTITKKLILAAAACIIMASTACDNVEGTRVNNQVVETFQPFKAVMLVHPVADFNKWKQMYNAGDSLRNLYGVNKHFVGRGQDDTSMVLVMNKISEGQREKDLALLPQLKEHMKQAGITAEPIVSMIQVIAEKNAVTESDRVMISFNVTDFKIWKNMFDKEGSEAGTAYGLAEKSIARNLVDSNRVYVQYVVTDRAKAEARIISPAFESMMINEGVKMESADVFFYTVAD
jgi:hypothetical protein